MASESESEPQATVENDRITVDTVLEVMENLKEVSGCSLIFLRKYFASKPDNLPHNQLSLQIKKALSRGVKEGKIAKRGNYKFVIGSDDDGSKKTRRKQKTDDVTFL